MLDVGALITFYGLAPAHHLITIRAADHFGQVTNIAEMPVTFSRTRTPTTKTRSARWASRALGLLYGGVIQTNGWALDWEGGAPSRSWSTAPSWARRRAAWSAPGVSAPLSGLSETPPRLAVRPRHSQARTAPTSLDVIVRDDLGVETYIGKRQFTVGNPTP